MTLFATATMGLESELNHELKTLGYSTKVFDGKVEFEGDLTDICKTNLWLRTAGRVYIKMGEFEATTFDSLFEQTQDLPWETWIGPHDAFPVTKVTSRKSILFSKSDSQALVKKAVVERLKQAHRVQTLPETGAVFAIRIQIENDRVTLSLDTSGVSLSNRGYRAHSDDAPLRETLAAGMLMLARWKPDRDVLLDPLCGTATILIEAGLMAKNMAPGLQRQFESENWDIIPKKLWKDARQSARDAIIQKPDCHIYGSDNNFRTLDIARKNIQLAGLDNVFVQTLPVQEARSRFDIGKIVTNPPYGARLSDLEETEALYKDMGKTFSKEFKDWSYYILSPHEKFDRVFGKKYNKNRKLYNGGIKCWLYQFFGQNRR